MNESSNRHVLAEGKYLRLVAAHGWEWVERVNTTGAVIIAAVTAQSELVLVEQYRLPLGARVVELPAGLVGDTADFQNERLIEAARRELLEETGYEAPEWRCLLAGPSSAGLTTETYALFLAREARQVAQGGGDDAEDIQVHVVPLARVEDWLEAKRQNSVLVDPRVYAGLYFATQSQDAKQ